MTTLCGLNCCNQCPMMSKTCQGCSGGHPCGGSCYAAECLTRGGPEALAAAKQQLVAEINALNLPGLRVEGMNELLGSYVNLEYPLGGVGVRLLQDDRCYFANQIEVAGSERCYGVVGDDHLLLVCTYGCMGADPELLLYKKR